MAESSNLKDESRTAVTLCPTVQVEVPRELVEREIIFEVMALRDERLLRTLSEEERRKLGENPAGQAVYLTVEQAARLGSITQGIWCKGTSAFTNGVTCKLTALRTP